jgi:hypothetical protein
MTVEKEMRKFLRERIPGPDIYKSLPPYFTGCARNVQKDNFSSSWTFRDNVALNCYIMGSVFKVVHDEGREIEKVFLANVILFR